MKKTTSSMMKPVYKIQSEARNAALRSGVGHLVDSAWSYYAQAWLPAESASYADSLCYTAEDCGSDWAYYEDAMWQVSQNIRNCGVSVVTDEDFCKVLVELGYSIVPCIDFDEDEVPIEWYEVFSSEKAEEDFYNSCDRTVILTDLWEGYRRCHYHQMARSKKDDFGFYGVVLDFLGDIWGENPQMTYEQYFPFEDYGKLGTAEDDFCRSIASREARIRDKKVVGEVTKIKVGGVTIDEDEVESSPIGVKEEVGGLEPDEPTMSDIEWDIKEAIVVMATQGFEMVLNPTHGSLPFVGYFTNDNRDEGGDIRIECRLFIGGHTEGDEIIFESTDSDGYEVKASEFMGWKSMRG